ncbi:MAG: hypothetical protein RMN52_07770 [Anaerolineae bacterium]|nr:hypothetical protein [Candidatus Roseilinea sp.]MDW8449885.1 hypothetical protein [Anaerolineae bacterium]
MTQTNPSPLERPAQRYRVRVKSHLDSGWLSNFPVVTMTAGYDASKAPVTTLVVGVQDQAELMGLLMELHGMGLTLLSVQALLSGQKRRS